ncbi:MAG: RluA family pseudouridine synthase [Xanthomonadales bacterium]|nr:RluA family pseudouridine synthase [Xanthomonadales bacterium]
MNKKPIFTVTANDVGQRLDNFLFKQRKHLDRNQWYKLMRKGQIRVNGKRVKPLYKLNHGDLVRIPPSVFFVESEVITASSEQIASLWQNVIFEDEDYLVIDKPAGLPSHTGTGHEFGLIEVVSSKFGYESVQLAHRLDKDTSGCVLLAKNRQALLKFQQAMKSKQITKRYLAVLDGVLEQSLVVDQALNTDNRANNIRTVVVSELGKPAQTTFSPIKHNNKYTLVSCEIQSGRTHQIRVHAQFIDMPVLGDFLYGEARPDLERKLYLHSEFLAFLDHHWQADTPETFTRIMG